MDVYERLEDMAADTAEARAAHILHGLGFTAKMQNTPTKDFSGGWRMRIALARYDHTDYNIYISNYLYKYYRN
jgi:ATP-binding cassette subfamily F protein 2